MTVKINELIIRAEISNEGRSSTGKEKSYPDEVKLQEMVRKMIEKGKPKNRRER